ncbi:methylenetetrahydrofolate reductase [Actinomyces sp. S6-Spd3]|uniref:methylenetetrahydrofolate reductase n=1 Tax=Actinomyces sp. S6-Spd3 TaxID=1284680 RepID=UPI00050E1C02|nr:methylenetetrahydrofolate reductase [Actinomyces sp. S6-Spd3]KGE99303.1 methylenetetrahydrofolate reductase [Actinomyces sp. S6-Spd3]
MTQPSQSSSDLTTLSFEVMPPRKENLIKPFWDTVQRLLSVTPDFLSVTYGAAGQDRHSARDVVRSLVQDSPVQPIAHLTCVGTTATEVGEVVSDYLDAGVRTFLALRGDPPVGRPDWQPAPGGVSSATELVTLIRSIEAARCAQYPGAALRAAFKPLTIAVAAFPAGNPAAGTSPNQEVERLLVKQSAGASFAITQLFWETDTYVNFLEKARSNGVTIPIVPGILPPTDIKRVNRMTELTGVVFPEYLRRRLESAQSVEEMYSVGVSLGARLARDLHEVGAPGIHMYTFNKAAPALDVLDAAGLVSASHLDPSISR